MESILLALFVLSLLIHLSKAQECDFCNGNIINPTVAFAEDGSVTCADIPLLIDIDGTEKDCYESMEKICCPTNTPADPCIFCEGGVTNPFLMVPPGFAKEEQTTCSVAKVFAASFSSDNQMCGIIKREEDLCCPPSLAPTVMVTRSPPVEPISRTTLPPTRNEFVSLSPTPPQVIPTEMEETEMGENLFNTPAVRGTGTVSGIAFYDINNNGYIEDIKEYGMWNIQASLYSCGDDTKILATTSSSTKGRFQFENLQEGSYFVKFDYPSYYTLGSVWNGDPATLRVDNSANPENGATNCFVLGDGDQFVANVALTITAQPTAVAQPLPAPTPIRPIPDDPTTITATPTRRPTEADIITTTSSPTAPVTCAFCENGIPDQMIMLPKGITCGSVKDSAAYMMEGSEICDILREEETLCCPPEPETEPEPDISTIPPTELPPTPQDEDPISPSPTSDTCTFCEGGIVDLGFRIPGRQGGTCGSQQSIANSLNVLSPMCATLQQFENICCPSEPVLNPCDFCEEGVPDPMVKVAGGQTCGAIQGWAAFYSVDSTLCLTFQESESKCCPGLFDVSTSPTLMPDLSNTTTASISPTDLTNVTDATNVTDETNVTDIITDVTDVTNSTDDEANETDASESLFDFDLGLDFELIGPITTNSIDMTLVGVDESEDYKLWQTTTADFIMDYFKDSGNVYDVSVEVAMQFETVAAITRSEDTGNAGIQTNRNGRHLEEIKAVKITYNQITSYRSKDPSIYDETYMVEEPFRGDPEGYISQLKSSSENGAYDAVVEVAVGIPAPAPPPTFRPISVPSVKEETPNGSMLYVIIGAACGAVMIIAAVGIFILRRRIHCRVPRTVGTEEESRDDGDVENRALEDLLVSTMSDTDDREEILPTGEMRIRLLAPKGRLLISLVNLPEGGPSYVTKVSRRSPLFGRLQLGDRIVEVDGEDVQLVSAKNVTKLLARKKKNPQRQITVLRDGSGREHSPQPNHPYSHEGNNHAVDPYASQYTDSDYTIVTVAAPMGTLGVFLEDSTDGGPAIVSEIARGSVLEGEIELFDRIASIDDTDVRGLKAFHISKLLAYKSRNLERKIVALREKNVGGKNRFIV